MKKSLLALSAAAIALTSMAATPKVQVSSVNLDRSTPLKSSVERLNPRATSTKASKTPAKAVSSADVITEVEGTVQNMTTTGSGYYAYWFWIVQYEKQPVGNHVVYGANNAVYFFNLMPQAATDTYVAGIKVDNKVIMPMGQVVMYEDDYGYGLQYAVLDYAEEEDPETGEVYSTYVLNEDIQSVTFTMDEEGGMTLEGVSEDRILGLVYTDDLSWSGYGVTELSMEEFNEIPVSLPADYGVSENFWQYINGDSGWSINWAQGGEDVYFQGFCPEMPNAWFKGTVTYGDDAATISVAQDQYLGVYAGFYIYTKCAKLIYEEGELVDAELMPEDYKYELIWDYEENTIVPKDPSVAFIFNAAKDRVYYLAYYEDFKLIHQEDFAGTPANPYDLIFSDTMEYYGYNAFIFTVPAISTENTLLDTNDLYYVVYVDGEEWEFDAEEYELEENMVEIPWNFGVYYIYNPGGVQREVDFFLEGISTLGVQSVYKYEGEETRSEIVTLDLEGGSKVIAVGDNKVASVKYYDIAGREVAKPANGIFVKKTTFSDGSVVSSKSVIR